MHHLRRRWWHKGYITAPFQCHAHHTPGLALQPICRLRHPRIGHAIPAAGFDMFVTEMGKDGFTSAIMAEVSMQGYKMVPEMARERPL